MIKMVTKLQRSPPRWRPPWDFLPDVQCCPGPTVERAPESEIVFCTHSYCCVMNSNFGYRTGPSRQGNWVQIMTNLVPQSLISWNPARIKAELPPRTEAVVYCHNDHLVIDFCYTLSSDFVLKRKYHLVVHDEVRFIHASHPRSKTAAMEPNKHWSDNGNFNINRNSNGNVIFKDAKTRRPSSTKKENNL